VGAGPEFGQTEAARALGATRVEEAAAFKRAQEVAEQRQKRQDMLNKIELDSANEAVAEYNRLNPRR